MSFIEKGSEKTNNASNATCLRDEIEAEDKNSRQLNLHLTINRWIIAKYTTHQKNISWDFLKMK